MNQYLVVRTHVDKNDNIRSIEDIHSEIMDKVIEFLDKK